MGDEKDKGVIGAGHGAQGAGHGAQGTGCKGAKAQGVGKKT